MSNNNPSKIPNSLRNASSNFPYVAESVDIYDKNSGKSQEQINDDTYRKGETYNKNEVYNKNETYPRELLYTQEQIDHMVSPTDQEYVNVSATASTTSMSDVAALIAATGEGQQDGTIYRVGNWDGSAYNTLVYTEYSWDGTNYVPLANKNLEQSNIRMSATIPGLLESVLSTEQPNVMLDNNTGCVQMVYNFA